MSCLCHTRLSYSSEGLAGEVWRGTEPWGPCASETKLRGRRAGGIATASCINVFAQGADFELELYFKCPSTFSPGLMLRIKALAQN